jgi:Family of unknown function (DUF6932)
MPIPDLTAQEVLPEGLHEATLEEIEGRFGRFSESDRRVGLFGRLRQFVRAVQFWGNAEEILVDGSFVTGKPRPTDIDIILVYRENFDFGSDVRPEEYNIINKKRARVTYGFDVVAVASSSPERGRWLAYFAADTRTGLRGKGLLRIRP